MKKIDYIKIIGSFLGIGILSISFLKILWVGEKLDTYIFSYLFGVGKYWMYGLFTTILILTLINKDNKIKKRNFIIGIIILTIGVIGMIANITANNFGFKIRGINIAYDEFNIGFSEYVKKADVNWFEKSIQGGLVGNFFAGIIGYASIVVSFIVYSLLSLVGISLILWGTYSEIYKKIWNYSGIKKLSWKNIKGDGIKKILFGEGDKGIVPLEETNLDGMSSHSKINQLDIDVFIELNENEYKPEEIEDDDLEITLFEEISNTHIETYKPSKENNPNQYVEVTNEIEIPKKEKKVEVIEVKKEITKTKPKNKKDRKIIFPYGDINE